MIRPSLETMMELASAAFLKGWKAYQDGIPEDANPSVTAITKQAWELGWWSAEYFHKRHNGELS